MATTNKISESFTDGSKLEGVSVVLALGRQSIGRFFIACSLLTGWFHRFFWNESCHIHFKLLFPIWYDTWCYFVHFKITNTIQIKSLRHKLFKYIKNKNFILKIFFCYKNIILVYSPIKNDYAQIILNRVYTKARDKRENECKAQEGNGGKGGGFCKTFQRILHRSQETTVQVMETP